MNDRELIELFLQGRLSEAEAGDVAKRIHSDAAFRKLFEQEAILESQLGNQSLAHESVTGLSTEAAWGDLVAATTDSGKSCNDVTLTDDEWRHMVAAAVETAPQPRKIVRFPGKQVLRYLAAAVIVLAAGAVVYISREATRHPADDIAAPSTVTTSVATSLPRYRDLEVFHIDTTGDSAIATQSHPGILAIAAQTAAVAGQHTTIECSEYRDTAITLDMASGTALFSVEKGKYRFFKVTTPFAEITVTGTIFNISIDTISCFVSVERGSVVVRQLTKNLSATVLPGETVEADSDTLVAVRIERGLTSMVAQKKLLADFLTANPLTANISTDFVGKRFFGSSGDTVIERLKAAIANNTSGIDTVVSAYVAGHLADTAACMLLFDLSRQYESRGKWLPAARVLEDIDHCDIAGTNQMVETALYRRGRFHLQAGDTAGALTAFTRFENNFPQSAWMQDIADLHLNILWIRGQMNEADTMITHLRVPTAPRITDRTIMMHSDRLRQHGHFDRARYWYETVVTEYPASRFRSDAMYWAGWCMVQQNIMNREKRAFNHK